MKKGTVILIVVLAFCLLGIRGQKLKEKAVVETRSVAAETPEPTKDLPILRRNNAEPFSDAEQAGGAEAAPVIVSSAPIQAEEPAPERSAPAETPAPAPVATPVPSEPARSYVLNTSKMKFHFPSCSSVKQMADQNRRDVEMTRSEIINMGYEPCGKCRP